MKGYILLLLPSVLLIATLSGCGNSAVMKDSPMALTSQVLGDYQISEIAGQAVLEGSNPQLSLNKEGVISGTSGCNNFRGDYEWVGTALTLSQMATTRKKCQTQLNAQELRLLNNLALVKSAKFDGVDLVLMDKENMPIIKATRQESGFSR